MAWTSPMTAVANDVFTAAQFNTHVRDNLLETAPAKATTDGGMFFATGANAIAERVPTTATVATSESTTSTSYTDLSTAGPAVTVTTGTRALVFISADAQNDAAGSDALYSYAVSGSTTVAAADSFGSFLESSGSRRHRWTVASMQTGLTAGSNTFTMKYRVSANTGTFQNRNIVVVPM
ncbi:hypothetical protein BJP40_06745 [Streptomyces sp. CC53]|uniref:hypothetical protein n=1 Tax=Streptomyces sp. CC53 TaxID=1906740 RepID=UPI0008DCD94D|nr:hypothetical protein [Streptomyces sp. CC53]OII61219.1 hypothetical protein BJP40_06745 [Streptomyces sp. CC53]